MSVTRSVYGLRYYEVWLLMMCYRRPVDVVRNASRICFLNHITKESWRFGGCYAGVGGLFVLFRVRFFVNGRESASSVQLR